MPNPIPTAVPIHLCPELPSPPELRNKCYCTILQANIHSRAEQDICCVHTLPCQTWTQTSCLVCHQKLVWEDEAALMDLTNIVRENDIMVSLYITKSDRIPFDSGLCASVLVLSLLFSSCLAFCNSSWKISSNDEPGDFLCLSSALLKAI